MFLELLTSYFSQQFATKTEVYELRKALGLVEMEWRIRMAAFDDALAELDTQVDALEAYVVSDEETDAAEVRSRVERIKTVLATARNEAPAEETPDTPGEEPAPQA